jgi:cholesterol transport system auxiliary component
MNLNPMHTSIRPAEHATARAQHRPAAWLRWLSYLLLTGLLIGCTQALPFRARTPMSQYLLEWQPGQPAQTAAADAPVLQLSAPHAAAGYGNSAMLYMAEPHKLARFSRHRWADAPARMLEPLLLRALQHSGLFSAVAAPGAAVQAGLRLDTELLQLQMNTEGGRHLVQLALRAALIDQRSGRQLAVREFHIEEPAATATPAAGVAAANRAVAKLLAELTAFLASQLAHGGAQP